MPPIEDDLDLSIAERAETDPDFPLHVAAGSRRLGLLWSLADKREELGLSQTTVAARMGTSQPTVARLETAGTDPKMSTVERYAIALGQLIEYSLVDADSVEIRGRAENGKRRRPRNAQQVGAKRQ